MSPSESSTAVNYDDPAQDDYSSAVASSSSVVGIESEADGPDPAVRDALKSSKERIYVLKLGEDMESLIQQQRFVSSPTRLARG